MTGNIVDGLKRFFCPRLFTVSNGGIVNAGVLGGGGNAKRNAFGCSGFAADKPFFFGVAEGTAQAIADVIAKSGNLFYSVSVFFHCPTFFRQWTTAGRPALAIEVNGRIDFSKRISDGVHCFNIMDPH